MIWKPKWSLLKWCNNDLMWNGNILPLSPDSHLCTWRCLLNFSLHPKSLRRQEVALSWWKLKDTATHVFSTVKAFIIQQRLSCWNWSHLMQTGKIWSVFFGLPACIVFHSFIVNIMNSWYSIFIALQDYGCVTLLVRFRFGRCCSGPSHFKQFSVQTNISWKKCCNL